ncbi:hypothetical protein CL619_03760 [archaeon]|nr:hypothetical protein [archaeon]
MAFKTFLELATESSTDPLVHGRFTKFSVGDFEREAILISQSKKNCKLQTGYEYANDLAFLACQILGDNAQISGEAVLVAAKKDPKQDIDAAGFEVKANRGKKYTLTFDLTAKQLIESIKKLGVYAFLFSKFNCDTSVKLKMKSTPPKPGSVKEKFCTLQVEPKLAAPLLDAFLFDVKERGFKKAEINHTFDIQDVVIPKEYENDYALARLHAKKKGKIKRKITLDGKEILATELDFEA